MYTEIVTRNDSFSEVIKFLNEIRMQNDTILSQNEQILLEQVKMSTKLAIIEKRIENIEAKIECDMDVSSFELETIKNLNDFKEFLKKIHHDKAYRSKTVGTTFFKNKLYINLIFSDLVPF